MYKSRLKNKHVRKTKTDLRVFFIFFITFFIFGGLTALLRAGFMQVKNFSVSGLSTISENSVLNMASSFISGNKFVLVPKSNTLFLSDSGLSEYLKNSFGGIAKVDVNKNIFTGEVDINITERTPDFLWCGSSCFLMSKDGLVYEQVGENGQAQYPDKIVLRGVLGDDPLLQNFASSDQMNVYESAVEKFSSEDIKINSISVDSEDRAIAETSIGNVIFSPEEKDTYSLAHRVKLLLQEVRLKNPNAHFEYIDARFGNKLFYKLDSQNTAQ